MTMKTSFLKSSPSMRVSRRGLRTVLAKRRGLNLLQDCFLTVVHSWTRPWLFVRQWKEHHVDRLSIGPLRLPTNPLPTMMPVQPPSAHPCTMLGRGSKTPVLL